LGIIAKRVRKTRLLDWDNGATLDGATIDRCNMYRVIYGVLSYVVPYERRVEELISEYERSRTSAYDDTRKRANPAPRKAISLSLSLSLLRLYRIITMPAHVFLRTC